VFTARPRTSGAMSDDKAEYVASLPPVPDQKTLVLVNTFVAQTVVGRCRLTLSNPS
jgi:hypothetical protein